jgi:hypothetical protein
MAQQKPHPYRGGFFSPKPGVGVPPNVTPAGDWMRAGSNSYGHIGFPTVLSGIVSGLVVAGESVSSGQLFDTLTHFLDSFSGGGGSSGYITPYLVSAGNPFSGGAGSSGSIVDPTISSGISSGLF